MSIAATTKNTVNRMKPGKVFSYRVFENFDKSPEPVIKAVNRLVEEGSIERLSRGKFYIPCLLYTSPSPRDQRGSRMPSSA